MRGRQSHYRLKDGLQAALAAAFLIASAYLSITGVAAPKNLAAPVLGEPPGRANAGEATPTGNQPEPGAARHQQEDNAGAASTEHDTQVISAQALLASLAANDRERQTLSSIIECESSWRQFDKTGEPLNSLGNIGLAQINRTVWGEHFAEKNIDIDTTEGNLRAALELYRTQGLAPWQQWSGHCFLPKLSAQGLTK